MMASSPLGEIEDLTLCALCKSSFNENDQQPKILSCKHHFCLRCVNNVLLKGRELFCVHCWKKTEVPDMRTDALPTYSAVLALVKHIGLGGTNITSASQHVKPPDKHGKSENCHTHAMPHTLWCHTCHTLICRACASQPDHLGHTVKQQADAKQTLRSDMHNELAVIQKMLSEIQHLVFKQRDFLLKILEACTTLKTQVETDLVNNLPSYELSEARECLNKARHNYNASENLSPAEIQTLLTNLGLEKERLQAKHQEMFLQCKLDDLIRNAGVVFDFDLLKQALAGIHSGEVNIQSNNGFHNPILFLANYCMSQLYSRHFLLKQQQNNNHLFLQNQNGNTDFHNLPTAVASHPPYIPLMMPNNKSNLHSYQESSLLKAGINNYVESSNNLPNLNITKTLNFGDGNLSLSSPKGLMQFQNDNLSLGLPNLLPPTPQLIQHTSPGGMGSQAGMVSPQAGHPGALMQPGLLPGNILQHSPQPTLMRNPATHIYPIFYFNIEVNGSPFGRILIEVRNDVAPKMAKNFSILSTGELGVGYKGCNIFQCWENESIITGDFELNNGRGGRSIFEDSFFMPDDTKILAIRGSVGMRRGQKRHDNQGLVGSQFRIILREMRAFTGIFAFVVEGLELVDRISQTGDSAGKPQSNIIIASCGKVN